MKSQQGLLYDRKVSCLEDCGLCLMQMLPDDWRYSWLALKFSFLMRYWRLPKPTDPMESSLIATFESLQDKFWEMLQNPFDVDAYCDDNACCLSDLHVESLQMVDDASVKLFDGDDVSKSGYCSDFKSDDYSVSLFFADESVDGTPCDGAFANGESSCDDPAMFNSFRYMREVQIKLLVVMKGIKFWTPLIDEKLASMHRDLDDEADWGFDLPLVEMDADMTSYVKKASERLQILKSQRETDQALSPAKWIVVAIEVQEITEMEINSLEELSWIGDVQEPDEKVEDIAAKQDAEQDADVTPDKVEEDQEPAVCPEIEEILPNCPGWGYLVSNFCKIKKLIILDLNGLFMKQDIWEHRTYYFRDLFSNWQCEKWSYFEEIAGAPRDLAAPTGKKVTCANNASYPIKGVGKILITISDGSDLCLPDVLYVPGIKKNLLSVSSLAKNGLRVIFEDDRCIVRDRENGYSLITIETKTQAMQDAELWHARFGHVGYGSLMTLQRHNMVHDLSLLEMPPRHVCEGCVLGKMHRFAFSQDGSVRATRKLQLVHSDVCGPMRTPSVGNSLYFVTFIDDFSRFCWVLKAKLDVFAIFQHYVSMVENETGCKVQTLRTDRGGEYMSGAFKTFLGKKGIKHRCTMPYTPQQNGVAERKNRSLMDMARCMLKAKSLPHKLWMEAVACAAHVLNRCPTRALKTITPYESWYDKKPSVSYLRVFYCLAYAHIPQQLRGKLDDKAIKCIFVGYTSGSKGYRLYNPATNKIFESRDVIFAETNAQPMVAFDVPHMQTQDVFKGFLPSFVENQESQQVDNFDQSFDQHVTPHNVEEIVREEQEVLKEERTLPKWV
ncbi:hypothetical protein L7F22_012881 [Adiantum nelumboides]|nr:hypothetical protein [Adiantum nelumboides]